MGTRDAKRAAKLASSFVRDSCISADRATCGTAKSHCHDRLRSDRKGNDRSCTATLARPESRGQALPPPLQLRHTATMLWNSISVLQRSFETVEPPLDRYKLSLAQYKSYSNGLVDYLFSAVIIPIKQIL